MVNRTKPAGSPGFEPYAMWFVVEPGPHESQASKGDASKTSEVTKPRLYTPDNVDLAYARTLWVGADNYKAFCQLYKDTEAWQTQFPKSQESDPHTSDTPQFTGDGGITPQQIDFIGGLIDAKAVDAQTIKEMCLAASNDATQSIGALKASEANVLIDTLKAY